MSGDGSDCDSLGVSYILSSEYCKEAAKAFDLDYRPDYCPYGNDYPRGCYLVDWDRACVNAAGSGRRRAGFQNICHNNYGIIYF